MGSIDLYHQLFSDLSPTSDPCIGSRPGTRMEDNQIHDLPALLQSIAAPSSQAEYQASEAKLQANYREPGKAGPG